MKISGKRAYLADFLDQEAAARAYDKAVVRLHARGLLLGDRADLNFNRHDYLDAEGQLLEEPRVDAALEKAGVAAASRPATSSTFLGVTLLKGRVDGERRWRSFLSVTGAMIYLGSFPEEEEAARMYDRAALAIRGDAAKLNFSREDYLDAKGDLLQDPCVDDAVKKAEAAAAKAAGRPAQASRFLGVHFAKHRGSGNDWKAVIRMWHKECCLGSFPDEEQAARMYDKVAIRVKGDKAKLNFSRGDYVDANGKLLEEPEVDEIIRTKAGGAPAVAGEGRGAAGGGSGEAAGAGGVTRVAGPKAGQAGRGIGGLPAAGAGLGGRTRGKAVGAAGITPRLGLALGIHAAPASRRQVVPRVMRPARVGAPTRGTQAFKAFLRYLG